jgi:iron complex outermembrane receptor protein
MFNALPVTNANVATSPVQDRQYEIGVKAEIGQTLLTLALFDITQPSAIYTLNGGSYTFAADALQRNLGVEAGLTGKVTPNLTLYGGVTVLDPKIVSNPSAPQDIGRAPISISKQYAKLYAEYAVDEVLAWY